MIGGQRAHYASLEIFVGALKNTLEVHDGIELLHDVTDRRGDGEKGKRREHEKGEEGRKRKRRGEKTGEEKPHEGEVLALEVTVLFFTELSSSIVREIAGEM